MCDVLLRSHRSPSFNPPSYLTKIIASNFLRLNIRRKLFRHRYIERCFYSQQRRLRRSLVQFGHGEPRDAHRRIHADRVDPEELVERQLG